jgi:hypothetical protein
MEVLKSVYRATLTDKHLNYFMRISVNKHVLSDCQDAVPG